MSRRRRAPRIPNKTRKRSPNRQVKPGQQFGKDGKPIERPRPKRIAMLDVSRDREFRFYLKQILDKCEIDDRNATAILATVHSKARMLSINEAKDYLKERNDVLPDEAIVEIIRLLNGFKKWR